jgi:hypothetical protein
MKFVMKLAAILAVLCLGFSTAQAESLMVRANAVNSIGFFYFYMPLGYGCATGGKPKVSILRAPEHGTLKTQWRVSTLGNAGGCKGKPGKGLAVWYTPNKGYHGPDKFRFMMTTPSFGASTNSKDWGYNITVQ